MVASDSLLAEKAARIRLVLTDCDGVLTDGSVYYSARGEEMKRFFIRDGMGVERLRRHCGVETGIVTGELSESVKRRAEKLKISELHLGCKNKAPLVVELAKRLGISLGEIAYIGDDVNDLEVLELVGLSACPVDAETTVRGAVDMICSNKGGNGAFRELAELVIASQTVAKDGVSVSPFLADTASIGVES